MKVTDEMYADYRAAYDKAVCTKQPMGGPGPTRMALEAVLKALPEVGTHNIDAFHETIDRVFDNHMLTHGAPSTLLKTIKTELHTELCNPSAKRRFKPGDWVCTAADTPCLVVGYVKNWVGNMPTFPQKSGDYMVIDPTSSIGTFPKFENELRPALPLEIHKAQTKS